jgi:hypothetical protein
VCRQPSTLWSGIINPWQPVVSGPQINPGYYTTKLSCSPTRLHGFISRYTADWTLAAIRPPALRLLKCLAGLCTACFNLSKNYLLISEGLKWITKSVMTSGTREISFLFSLYILNEEKGKYINRLAPDVRASLLITACDCVIVLFSQSQCVCASPLTLHPSLQAQPFLLDSHRHHSLFRQKGNRHVAMDLWRHYRRLWDRRWAKRERKEFHSLGWSVTILTKTILCKTDITVM